MHLLTKVVQLMHIPKPEKKAKKRGALSDVGTFLESSVAGNSSGKGQLILKCPFGCLQIDQKTNEIFVRISALASKKRSNPKTNGTLYH